MIGGARWRKPRNLLQLGEAEPQLKFGEASAAQI
jgi:hypothetical protein